MKRIIAVILMCLISTSVLAEKKKKQEFMKIPAGANVPSLGMAFDADYDAEMDNIIPGHKILSVALTNNSINVVTMDAINDEWVVIDYKGNKHKAINDLKKAAPDTYIKLPEKLRNLIQYPEYIQVGETKVIDLLFRDGVTLDAFRAVRLENEKRNMKIEIVAKE